MSATAATPSQFDLSSSPVSDALIPPGDTPFLRLLATGTRQQLWFENGRGLRRQLWINDPRGFLLAR
jgi:hypothetical protein